MKSLLLTFLFAFNFAQKSYASNSLEEAENFVERALLQAVADELPGIDLQCSPATKTINRFGFISKTLTAESREMCEAVLEYVNFVDLFLQPFSPLTRPLNMTVVHVESVNDVSGTYNMRLPLKLKELPSIDFFFYENILGDLHFNKPIWAHEYGHAVLHEKVENYFFEKLKNAYIQKIKLEIENDLDSKELNKHEAKLDRLYELEDIVDSSRQKKIARDLAFHNLQVAIISARIDTRTFTTDEITFDFYLLAYHEFFADLFAGLYFNDLNIIGENFYNLGPNFVAKADSRKFFPDFKSSLGTWDKYDSYSFFTPARHATGQIIEDSNASAYEFINSLAEYIVSEIENLILTSDESLFLSYADLKARIEQIDNYAEIKGLLESLEYEFKISDSSEIIQYCEFEFDDCKKIILDQLDLKNKGLLKLAPDLRKSNERLIRFFQETFI